jgi:hypothetical protein
MPRRIPLLDHHKVVKFAHYQYLELRSLHKPTKLKTHEYDYWGPILNQFTQEFLSKSKHNPNTYECFLPNISFVNLPVL